MCRDNRLVVQEMNFFIGENSKIKRGNANANASAIAIEKVRRIANASSEAMKSARVDLLGP